MVSRGRLSLNDELLRVLGVMFGEQVRMGRGGLGGSGKGIWIWGGIKRGVAMRMGARVGVLGALREGAMREGAMTGMTDDVLLGIRVA